MKNRITAFLLALVLTVTSAGMCIAEGFAQPNDDLIGEDSIVFANATDNQENEQREEADIVSEDAKDATEVAEEAQENETLGDNTLPVRRPPSGVSRDEYYLADVKYTAVNSARYITLSYVASQEVGKSDSTECPLKSDCIKYNTWLYGGYVSNKYENGSYVESYNWNTAFVSWCAEQASLIEYGCFPKAYSGSQLYAWCMSDHVEMITRGDMLAGQLLTADDLICFPVNGDYRFGIVTSASANSVTYVMGDVDCSVRKLTASISELAENAVAFRWYQEGDNLWYYIDFLCNEIGMTRVAAYAVLANMRCESGFNPHAVGDYGSSYGLCQWHNGRWDTLVAFCEVNGYDWTAIDGQLQFLKYELENNKSMRGLLQALNKCTDNKKGAKMAGAIFCRWYEAPKDIEGASIRRGQLTANYYYPLLSGK